MSMTTEHISIMSFNIRLETGADTNEKNWGESRRYPVVAYLNACDADVICMQEVVKTQFDFIKENTSALYDAIYYPRENGANPEGLAILYKKELKLVNEERYWLSETPDEISRGWGAACYRIAVNATFLTPAGNTFSVGNNHLDHISAAARDNGIALVMERLALKHHTVVCGDFNASKDSSVYKTISAKMQDSQAIATTTDDGITFHNWGENLAQNDPRFCIDFLFVTNGTKVDSYKIVRDMDDKGNFLSDHFPVVITLALDTPANA